MQKGPSPGIGRAVSEAQTDRRDLVGTALSGLCAVHCLSMPAVMSLAPAASSVVGGFHPVLLLGVTAVAAWAFVPGFRRHRSLLPLLLGALGIGLLGTAALAFEESVLETVLSLAGAAAMVAAHLKNRALLPKAQPSAA